MLQNIKTERLMKIFIYVVLSAFALSIIIPVSWVFLASIKENSEFYGNPFTLPQGFHYQNFVEAFTEARMGEFFMNSIIVTSLSLVILLVVALPASYVLARYEFKIKKLLNTFFMAGLFINVNYIVVPIFLMLVGFDKAIFSVFEIKFMLNNLGMLSLVYAATALPFTIYLLTSFFMSIPKDFEEASEIDGASDFKTMIHVMFPMAKSSIVTVILFNFLAFWNEYIIALTLMPAKDAPKTLPVGLMNLMAAQKSAVEYGRMYAGLVMIMLPTLILYMMVQKKLTLSMTQGGVKG